MSLQCYPTGAPASAGSSDLPALPVADGDYSLRVANSVGSWVRTPVFQSVTATNKNAFMLRDAGAVNHTFAQLNVLSEPISIILGEDGGTPLTTVINSLLSAEQNVSVEGTLDAVDLRMSATGTIRFSGAPVVTIARSGDDPSGLGIDSSLIVDTYLRSPYVYADTEFRLKNTGSGDNYSIGYGSGSPEGVVTANPSSEYLDFTNGDQYVKHTGVGNTGWKLVVLL